MGLGVPKGSFGDSGLLLDELSENVEVAFSLRKVRAEYNGPCVRVRNSSGTLKDIGFLSNGSIDEAALNAHCGSNDGTVQTWYNQSAEGGQYNAVQDTAANQPIIYDASAGGYLGYVENTGNMYLRFENQLTGVTDTAIVYEHVTNTDHPFLLGAEDEDVNHGIVVNRNVVGVDGFALQAGSGQTISTHTGDTIGEKFASFIYTGGTDKFISVNGYVSGEGAVTDSIDLDLIFTRDVASGGSEDNNDFVGKIWEVFLSTSDLSANRIALENSILSANGLTVPEQTLLEKYDGAEGAFSTRCINREHVGPIVEVRGNSTVDVYLDSNGVVNEDRITGLCTGVDGFVKTWYDQSSFGYDVTNSTDAQQPKIHDATDGVVLLNGQPAVEFDGSDDILESSSQTINTEAIIAVASTNNEATNAQHIIRQGTAFIRFDAINHVEYRNNVNLRDDSANNTPGLVNDNAALVSWYTKGTSFNDANASWKWYFNGDLLGTQTGNNLSSESGPIKIGAQSTTSERLNGKVCEAIIIDKRNAHYDRADQIHKDINAHYLIYQEVDTTTGFISNSAYNAKLAHSVRKLSGSLLCCQVERSSDSAKRNIGWGSDGFVDTAAIEDFCGSSSGKILTVYDQSGQGYHAYTDPSKTNFLWIYDGTDIYTSNGLPAFYNKDASTDASYVYSNFGSYSASNKYSYADQTKASYSVVCGPITQNADTTASGQDYLILTADMTVYRDTGQRLRVDIFDSGEGVSPSISTADAASSQRVIMAGGTLGGTVWGHIDDSEDNDNVDSPEGWYGIVSSQKIDFFFSANENQADNPYIQETVFYDNDFRVEGTLESLKTEVNDAFSVFASDETPTSGFLNEFSGAAAAYSVRKLGDSPVAMRVRKTVSAVDYYQVIGFDANGDLDTAAIEEFGGSNDVFVQTWYDQSGNGRHQVQDTPAEQPKIYDGTDGIIYENDKPAVEFSTGFMSDSSANKIDILGHSSHSVFNRGSSAAREVLYGAAVDTSPFNTFAFVLWDTTLDDARVFTNFAADQNFDLSESVINQRTLSILMPDLDSGTISAQLDNQNAVDNTGNPVNVASASDFVLRLGSQSYNEYTGNIQEFVIYEDGKSGADRTNIQKNQNNYFLIHQEASASPATGLLSEAPNATAAYSVRQLGDAKLCMKVRRGSDSATKNIGFKNGVVDTAAIEAFCGNSDGTVAVWYDQSGSGNHAIQSTGSAQPKIYDNVTGIEKDNNGNITTRFITDGYTLDSEIFLKSDDPDRFLISFVADVDDSDNIGEYFAGATSSSFNFFENDGANSRYKLRHTNEAGTGNVNTSFTEPDPAPTSDKIASFVLYAESDEKKLKLNGTQLASSGGKTWTDSNDYQINIGKIGRGYSSDLNNSMYSEFIVWESYADGDVETVGDNVNKHYKTQTPFTTGLLDSYPGATAAYSLRRLSSTYTGPAIEVTSNSTTQDIGFDIEGNLDTSALAAFCGSNDGTVSKWYDQSGNSNDLVQTTANDQPKVYDGTDGVVTISDQPAVEFYESNGKFLESSSNITVDDFFVLNVIKKSIHAGSDCLWGFGTSGDTEFQHLANLNNGEDYYIRRDNGSGTNVNSYIGSQLDFEGPHNVVSLSYDQTNPVLRINGKVEWDADASGVYGADDQRIVLGDTPQENAPYRGKQQEFLIYPSDMRTKVAGIEKNINKHYSIYEQPLLDVSEDAAVAFSLRRLRSDYTGPAINVYNGTDYKDIYFRSNGTLDTGAISKFCGNNDGRVAVWYDQSGNNFHFSQTDNTLRPTIYTSGSVFTSNSKPSIKFGGAALTNTDSIVPTASELWVSWVARRDTDAEGVSNRGLFDTFGDRTVFDTQVSGWLYDGGYSGSPIDYNNEQKQAFLDLQDGNGNAYVNGVFHDSDAYTLSAITSDNKLGLGGTTYIIGDVQEFIIWSTNQSENRKFVESNMNHYYSVY